MSPLDDLDEEEAKNIARANKLVYAYYKTEKRCPYNDKVLEEHDKVDCDFGDTADGMRGTPFRGSPLYPQTFQGIGLDGLYGYPLGFYADNNESRNLFFGLFSLLGFNTKDELVKLADHYGQSNDKGKTDILNNLIDKLNRIKAEYTDTFDKIEKYLDEYRQKYEGKRADTGLLWQLSDAWFGSRQVNR